MYDKKCGESYIYILNPRKHDILSHNILYNQED